MQFQHHTEVRDAAIAHDEIVVADLHSNVQTRCGEDVGKHSPHTHTQDNLTTPVKQAQAVVMRPCGNGSRDHTQDPQNHTGYRPLKTFRLSGNILLTPPSRRPIYPSYHAFWSHGRQCTDTHLALAQPGQDTRIPVARSAQGTDEENGDRRLI